MTDQLSQLPTQSQAKSDAHITTDVLSELLYEPAVGESGIIVLVTDGVATLKGTTHSHGEKSHALVAARRVSGVSGINDEIEVVIPAGQHRTDADIAAAARKQITWSTCIPAGAIIVTVRDGWVTLEGDVEWWYQMQAAEDALLHMAGVKGIWNLISIKPLVSAVDVEQSIRAAFDRHAMLDARDIDVETYGSKVTLNGMVANAIERDEAERVAWAAPGVLSVDNQIRIKMCWGLFV